MIFSMRTEKIMHVMLLSIAMSMPKLENPHYIYVFVLSCNNCAIKFHAICTQISRNFIARLRDCVILHDCAIAIFLMFNSEKIRMATYNDFLAAYKECKNVVEAERKSKYYLPRNYPRSGYYVYLLIDPRTVEIRYVGKGIGGRVLKHEERTRRGCKQNPEKVKWLQELFAEGKEAVKRVLVSVENEDLALAIETATIKFLSGIGGLTNIVHGEQVKNSMVRQIADQYSEQVSQFLINYCGG